MLRCSPLIALALLTVAAAKAPPVDPRLRAEFAQSDTDGNGVLSRAEVRARVARMDAGASQLGTARATALADRLFALADVNGDNGISPVEMQGMFRAMARRYDTNGDGVISVAERKAARAAALAEAKTGPDGKAGR